ncbi:hypothetical protein [Mesomycoplasma conjunctivae]|uniref:hypothetical protein n=1 Tax=Mesomycoplasma conjunctivae TaxID=45361 RepID=UPI003DA653F6
MAKIAAYIEKSNDAELKKTIEKFVAKKDSSDSIQDKQKVVDELNDFLEKYTRFKKKKKNDFIRDSIQRNDVLKNLLKINFSFIIKLIKIKEKNCEKIKIDNKFIFEYCSNCWYFYINICCIK